MFSMLKNSLVVKKLATETEELIAPFLKRIDKNIDYNQAKVLAAFREYKVSDNHFVPSTGYGYNDDGRDTLEKVYAKCFGAEAGLVRPQIISGTHAIGTTLFGILRPGDELLYITGKPYDTLMEIVGESGKGIGSLKEYNITYNCVDLTHAGEINYDEIKKQIKENTKIIGIQRSKGYANRPSFTIKEIKEMVDFVKSINNNIIVFVDNCYGEFVEELEPTDVGADIMAGSLIKNPGGGIAKTGGYIVGKKNLVEMCSYRLTTPGIGAEAGASLYSLLEMYQGFFLAPHVVGQALKGAIFTSAILEKIGMKTSPSYNTYRTDLIQSVQFDNPEMMITFCQAIQYASPVNSQFKPIPGYMPGYEDDVIMAAGTFIQGASIELTADGPLRPPYIAFVQGGLTYSHVKIAICLSIDKLLTEKLLNF
ncbi:MAG: aluminum resistance protein [Bacillales bacterium]|jgi:cystathionine beta-lyase family protein involved in aluminum resistance|nr:aluminum resistance protein [Bacillales bacterium]